jgi:hypothetical protein
MASRRSSQLSYIRVGCILAILESNL